MTNKRTSRSGTIFIAGMHHSGTHLINEYLQILGGSFVNVLQKNKYQTLSEDFKSLNTELLKAVSSDGKGGYKPWGYSKDHVLDYGKTSDFKSQAKRLINKGKSQKHNWIWEDANSTLLLDFWYELDPEATFVLVYRDPWEVKKAVDNQGVLSGTNDAFDCWKLYNEKLLSFYEQHKAQCLLISSNGFNVSPKTLGSLIHEKLGFDIAVENIDRLQKTELNASYFSKYDSWDSFLAYKKTTLKSCLDQLNEIADIDYTTSFEGLENKITVVIPCYNHGAYIRQCVLSVYKALNNNEFEIIIVNDGSTDKNTVSVLNEIEKQTEGIRVIHQENKGLSEARNTGFRAATTPYILPLDSDNLAEPQLLIETIKAFETDEAVGVVFSYCRHFGVRQGYVNVDDFDLPKMLAKNYVDALAGVRKKVWEDNGGYVPMELGYEDWEFWINALVHDWKFKKIEKYLFDYRIRENSMVQACLLPENQYKVHEYFLKNYHDYYIKYFEQIYTYIKIDYIEMLSIVRDLQDSIIWYKKDIKIQKDINKMMHSKLYKIAELYAKLLYKLKPAPGREVIDDHDAPPPKSNIAKKFTKRAIKKLFNKIRQLFKLIFKHLYLLLETEDVTIMSAGARSNYGGNPYQRWRELNTPSSNDLEIYHGKAQNFEYQPKISVVVPVYNPPIQLLQEAIESVIDQVYSNWELCIADDNSTDPGVKSLLQKYEAQDERIKVVYRTENGHISENTNSALSLATGEFIALLDHDDLLPEEALYEIVKELNNDQNLDFIYTDEDRVDEEGNYSEPYFKPDFCLDSLLSRNYITHLAVIRKSIIDQIGGFRKGFEGSQDYDLFLRVVEVTDKIKHLPKVLYHWRIHSGSVTLNASGKNYAYDAGEKAIKEFLEKRNEKAKVELIDNLPGFYNVRYDLINPGKVSIIIPSKDQAKVLKTCIDSIINRSTYDNYEIILLDNNSADKAFFSLVDNYKKSLGDKFVYVECKFPFNYSKLMNIGVKAAKGEYIVLLNNDTEIITPDWLQAMMEQAQRPDIGCVGTKLLFPNDTIQHAGVVMGLGGIAGHCMIAKHRDDRGYYYNLKAVNNYSAVTAACLMVKTSDYWDAGGFEEMLAVEFNDVDFCLKVRELGRRNVWLPHVELYHYESLSRGNPKKDEKAIQRHLKETGIIITKWQKYIDHDPCYNPNLTLDTTDFSVKV